MEKTKLNKLISSIKNKAYGSDITTDIPQNYQYIENLENTNEDECLKLDNKNKEIYKHNNDLYKSITNKLKKENAMIKIETPPSPPTQPNNYERFIMHKTRNVSKNVRHQSFATQYLLNNGYEMCLENKEENNYKKFEPYEAIEIVEKIENTSIENLIKKSNEDNRLKRSMSMNYIYPNLNNNDIPMASAPPAQSNYGMPVLPSYTSTNNLSSSLPTNLSTPSSQHHNTIQVQPASHSTPSLSNYYYKKS